MRVSQAKWGECLMEKKGEETWGGYKSAWGSTKTIGDNPNGSIFV